MDTQNYTSRPVAYEHLSALLSSASSYNVLLVERAIAGLWRLLLIIANKVLCFEVQ